MNRARTARRTVAGLLLPAALLSAAACGGADDPEGASQDASSAAVVDDATPAVAPGSDVPVEDLLAMVEAGFADATTSSVELELTGGPLEVAAEGEVDYRADPADVALRLDSALLGGQGAELRVVDGVLYLQVPALSGDDFVRIDPDQLGALPGGGFLGRLDPRSQLETLREGIEEVEYVGSEEVAGEELDHYRVSLDPAVLAEGLGSLPGRAPQTRLPDEVDYDLWLDDQDRLRRLEADLGGVELVLSVDDYGDDVSIQAPDPSQVTDAPGLPGLGAGAGAGDGTRAS